MTSSLKKETKPTMGKAKVMSYEEKSVGSTAFFKCEACPYMALAEDDIKFHLFTFHPELARRNGLADNIQIPCPGCTSVFDAEETLRTHLRSHHKMGIKDIKKMIKSLVQIALKDAKLKKEDKTEEPPPPPLLQSVADVKIPQVIEIVPDIVNANSNLPKGVAYISVDELNKMSTPNFEKIDPKDIIQEASINIVYTTNEVSTQYISVAESRPSTAHSVIQMGGVPPDLISSIQPRVAAVLDSSPCTHNDDVSTPQLNPPHIRKPEELNQEISKESHEATNKNEGGIACMVNGCYICLKDENNLAYHRKCHQSGKLVCPECSKVLPSSEALHTHLWKIHAVDLELPTCDVCGYKTYRKYRLLNIHMKCHGKLRQYICPICSKAFKTCNQLSKHKLIHKKDSAPLRCSICSREFGSERRLKEHVAAVHEKLKPYKCSHCEYTAARREELKLHMRSHTGDKPYSCDKCEYRSADHNAMRRHKKTHSKEKSYKCKFCPYSTIQSTVFASHMISTHPNVNSTDVHRCPYCKYKSVNKDNYVMHLTTHTDKEGVQLLVEMSKNKTIKPSWTIPSETEKQPKENVATETNGGKEETPQTVNEIPIEVYDCDSLSESMPQNYSKSFCVPSTVDVQQTEYSDRATDFSKEDNSDCLISESSTDTLIDRHQYTTQINYDNGQNNLHGFLNTAVSMEQHGTLMQNSNVNSLAPNPCAIASSISNNIMSNFPIRLPPAPPLPLRNSIMLKPVDKISLPMTKVTGPIIKPTQILPVPASSNSPVNASFEEGAPRKKPKISVKSNLILKGPDQENMFHSQQKMAFRRLDSQRFGLGGPVTFNNLITTQFMQLPPEPSLGESPGNMLPYSQETMMVDSATTPVDNEMNNDPQIFTFNQQMSVNTLTMLPPPDKIQTNDPSYIKLEATIKQNTQSPSLERMCNANLMNNATMAREYKASPPPEDMNKNMSLIKNEMKSDGYYNIAMSEAATDPSIIDQYLMDNMIGEQYAPHMDLSAVVLQEISDQQSDVIEIDDNSDDNKMLPRYEMNFPLESLYLMHNDFHFLENEIPANNVTNEVNEINRMVSEVPIVPQKDSDETPPPVENSNAEFTNFIQGKKDPMMNTSVRPTTNKINVKNIELMKN